MRRYTHSARLQHLTLNTGHNRSSPRSEVADDVIDILAPFVAIGGGVLADTGWKLQMVHGPPYLFRKRMSCLGHKALMVGRSPISRPES